MALKSKCLTEILVIDFGSEKPVKLSRRLGKQVKCIRLEAETWSLAEAINAGVLLGRNKIYAKTDADILINARSGPAFDEAVRQVATGHLGLIVTQTVDLDARTSLAVALKAATSGKELSGNLRPKWGQGGLVFFSRDAWDRIGGFDSRFTGWGNEDNDFQERMRHAGIRFAWADRSKLSIYHVWHPPSYARTGIASQRQKNQEIAKSDRSVFRSLVFRHSDALMLAAPAVLKSVRPLVTLAIATAGRPGRVRMITEAINSFKDQVNNDVEVIVTDNGSSDSHFASLKKALAEIMWPSTMRVERLSEGSIPKARNAITAIARGRYTCVVDDDDIALPNRLRDHLKVFEKDGRLHGSHGGWIDFDEATGLFERNQGKERTLATLLKGTGKITAHPASFYRTDVLRAVPYDESFALGSDLDLALRMALQGFEIAHTRSYLTLRRFHESNVTLTGLSDQVSNGLASRNRVAAALGWDKLAPLAELAKANDNEIYCSNVMSLESIVAMLPGYVGAWRIFIPVALIERAQATPRHLNGRDTDKKKRLHKTIIEQVHDIVPGNLCMRRAGSNKPVCFRTDVIKGIDKALDAKRRIEALLQVPVELISHRQSELDRQVPFDWKTVTVEQGKRILKSRVFDCCEDVLLARAQLATEPDMADMTAVVADWEGQRESYFLLTAQVKGYDDIRRAKHRLEALTGAEFVQIGSGGAVTDVTMGGRSH